jgi:hypothetical protein
MRINKVHLVFNMRLIRYMCRCIYKFMFIHTCMHIMNEFSYLHGLFFMYFNPVNYESSFLYWCNKCFTKTFHKDKIQETNFATDSIFWKYLDVYISLYVYTYMHAYHE